MDLWVPLPRIDLDTPRSDESAARDSHGSDAQSLPHSMFQQL